MTVVALVALSQILAQQFCGFSVSSFQNPQNQHKKIETPTNYMSNTKSNSDTLIASFLLPWKVTNHSTGKEQPNNHKKPCAWINPRGWSLFQGKFSQKIKKPKSFRLFDFSNFSNLSNFSTFRLFDFFEFFDFSSRNLLACELFDFSTFRFFDFSRANIVIFTVWPIPARRAHSHQCIIVSTGCIRYVIYIYIELYIYIYIYIYIFIYI